MHGDRQTAQNQDLAMTIVARTPTTIITGFLGAGKTTFINTLLAHKNTLNMTDKWAILVNEFGKIGIDGKLFTDSDVAIKEVSGGCICCTNQLSLQIALVRLLSDHKPSHLIIEPTGLAHPDELLSQLGAPHWQTSLHLRATICILNAAQWQEEHHRNHDGYQAHVKFSDIVIINRAQMLSTDQYQALRDWINSIHPNVQIIDMNTASADELMALLGKMPIPKQQPIKVALNPLAVKPMVTNTNVTDDIDDTEPPYRYHDKMAGFHVGGWRLPKEWRFDGHELQKWLLNLPHYARIKGIIRTQDGWISLNITQESISIQDRDAQDDSRLELILHQEIDWDGLDGDLMGFLMGE